MRRRKARIIIWLNSYGMIKIALSITLVIAFVGLFTHELPSTRTWSYWTMPLSGKVIALDAGHGGVDGGASSKEGVIEKDVSLDVALYLRDYLQQAGAVVVMTRESDRDLAEESTKGYSKRKTEDLLNRVELIQRYKANMSISIHLNSIPSDKWRGAQTFYFPSNASGKKLAESIQHEIRANLNNTDRVPKTNDSFYLLKALSVPSVLVEIGFLSNSEEARLMADASYQKKMAEAIYLGINRYIADAE